MSALDLILIGVAALVTAYLLLILVVQAIRPIQRAGTHLRKTLTAPVSVKFDELDRESRLRDLEEEMQRALGLTDGWGSDQRAEIVEAAIAAQQITVFNQQLHKTVGQCLDAHWAIAQGLNATHMSEAARHPWSRRLRQSIIDLSDLLSQKLERYPLIFDSPELMRLQLGIRWVGPTCALCPYWTSTVAEAPRICPTANAMGHKSSGARSGGVVNAQIIDPCRPEHS